MTAQVIAFTLAIMTADPAGDLNAKLQALIDQHHGSIAIYVKDIQSGKTTSHHENDVMTTASLIKVAVMVEAYWQADEMKVNLAKMITLGKDDKVQGAGILTQHFSDGLSISLLDYIRLMIVYSDNTATNIVLDQVGIKNVNDRMEKLGLKETKINAKVFKGSTTSVDPERTKRYGLGSTTAAEMSKLFELILEGKIVSPDACKAMLGHLKSNDDKEMLVRYLPKGTVVAHKTGAVNAARTDCGIIYVPSKADPKKKRAVIVCVLTNENKDQTWEIDNEAQVTIAKIGKEVFDWYAK